jgi:predicted Fe-Mo cluster-binding NifX family protein
MSKVAIATVKGGSADQVSPVFGRCQTFTIIEVENGEIKEEKVLQNEFASAERGAGIQAAGMVARENVEAVVAGSFGPNVYSVCGESGIKPLVASGITAKEAAVKFEKGELEEISKADAGGSPQMPDQGGLTGGRPGGGMGGGAGGAGGAGGRGRGFGGGRG